MLSSYMSKTLLSILVVPNKTDFYTIPTFSLIPSVSIHPLKPSHPRAPATTGTTSTFFSDQSFFSSLFKFWYFSIFSISFSRILQSPGIATSVMTHDFSFSSTKYKLGLLASTTLSHGYLYPRLMKHHHVPQLLQGNARTTWFIWFHSDTDSFDFIVIRLAFVLIIEKIIICN